MNRRNFLFNSGKALTVTALASVVSITTACPTWLMNLYADIMKYVPVGLAAFNAILNILTGAGVIPPGAGTAVEAIANLVKVAFADLQAAITQYQNAPAADKATLLGEISVALATVEANLQAFWSNLNIPDVNLANIIEGLLGVILGTLAAFAAQLPAPPAAPDTNSKLGVARSRRANLQKLIRVTAKKRTVKQFKADFNIRLTEGGYGKNVIY